MDKNRFDILKTTVVETTEDSSHLSFLQKKIAKWFKIDVEKRFYHTLKIEPYITGNEPKIGETIVLNTGDEYVIKDISMRPDPFIMIKSFSPSVSVKENKIYSARIYVPD